MNQLGESSTARSRFDRRGQIINESRKTHGITFADDLHDTQTKLVDVQVVESYKEHNYDNTHKP